MSDAGYRDEAGGGGDGFLTSLPVILWERRWFILVPLVLGTIAATVLAFVLPRSYVSTATLLVESQDLPGGAAGDQGSVIDRRMARVRQQILSRSDLVQLIQDNDLYDVGSRSEPLSTLVDRMRDATSISAVNADISNAGGGNQGSIAFQLSFAYPQAAQAQLVAQTFIDRLLKLDASQTQSSVAGNVRFLEDQEAGLNGQIRQIEGQINRLTGQNGTALANASGLSSLNMGGGNYESQIADIRRQNAQLQAQVGRGAVDRDPGVVAAEQALSAARATYTEDHPDVRLAQTRLVAARAAAAQLNAGAASSGVQTQIAVNNATIAQLNQARAAERSRTAVITAAQARGPQVAAQVQQLQSRADLIKGDLGRISSQLLQARGVERLTDAQRGERLTLIDPPVTPDRPTSPNRPMLIAAGVAGGLGLGLAIVLGLELLLKPIRSVAALTRVTGTAPLGVVPVLKPGRSKSRRSGRRGRFAALWPFGRRNAVQA